MEQIDKIQKGDETRKSKGRGYLKVCFSPTATLLHLREKVVEDTGDEARRVGELSRVGEGSKHCVSFTRACLAIGKDT